MEPTREVLIVVMTMALEHLRDIIRDVGDPNLDCEETLQSIKARATKALELMESAISAQ
jgi:hypothetical protein